MFDISQLNFNLYSFQCNENFKMEGGAKDAVGIDKDINLVVKK